MNLEKNITNIFPGVLDKLDLSWNYNVELDTTSTLGQNPVFYRLCTDTNFLLSQMNTVSIEMPKYIQWHPMVANKKPVFPNSNKVQVLFTSNDNIRKRLIIDKQDYDNNLLEFMYNKFIIHPKKVVHLSTFPETAQPFSLISFFNREYAPFFLTCQEVCSPWGDITSMVTKVHKTTHKLFKNTFKKLESLLRGIDFRGIITLSVHKEDDFLYVDNVLTTLRSLEIYSVLTHFLSEHHTLANFLTALTAPLGFGKVDCGGVFILSQNATTLVERLTLPPYPIVDYPLGDMNLSVFAKGIKLNTKVDNPKDSCVMLQDAEVINGDTYTTGALPGCICSKANDLKAAKEMNEKIFQGIGINSMLTYHKFDKEENNYVA